MRDYRSIHTPLLGEKDPEERSTRNGGKAEESTPLKKLVAAMGMLWLFWYMIMEGTLVKIIFPEPSRPIGRPVSHPWKSFSWDNFEGSENLEFRPCYEKDLQCAKLLLPLDYFNGTYPNRTVSIAITKVPAKVPVSDSRYGGPVLVNPGGPGGSGVYFARAAGSMFQWQIAPAPGSFKDGKFYDIIGFDPRGIAFSEPAARCMPDEPTAFDWYLRQATEGMLGSSDAALSRLWSMNHAFGASCKQNSDAAEDPDIKQYMSTASVATDMIKIAEKHAEWVAEQNNVTDFNRDDVKLQYWGFSYGTYLGSTFASMYPDRIARMVLDGVVNVYDYDNSLGQGSLHDTEKDLKSFYSYCKAAGSTCPFTSPTSSIQDIELRVQSIVQSLYHNPIMIATRDYGPDIFTYTDVMTLIFITLYVPKLFPWLAFVLSSVEDRALDGLSVGRPQNHVYQCDFDPIDQWIDGNVAQMAVLCGDGLDQTSTTLSEFEQYWQQLHTISPSVGSLWAMLRMECASWPIKPLYRFGGTDKSDSKFGAANGTSHPILWVSSTADPVTPLASARLMQARFPGSGLLIQDSAGHCSFGSVEPSPCTIARVQKYFQSGELPDQDTICVPEGAPWFALNSTDPDSPFYDPELGPPAENPKIPFDEKNPDDYNLDNEDMLLYLHERRVNAAAKKIRRWAAAQPHSLGGSLVSRKVRGLVMDAVRGDEYGFPEYDAGDFPLGEEFWRFEGRLNRAEGDMNRLGGSFGF
ncbi:unnamed protein product [Periconia digitata]|uniref:Uncharacterized protein n=1 Tax=Periconia digitata TaxID=1303443 RepID=A0A9W4U4E4_9PLEO|nr:unnamed protein product [Periconia digitata]